MSSLVKRRAAKGKGSKVKARIAKAKAPRIAKAKVLGPRVSKGVRNMQAAALVAPKAQPPSKARPAKAQAPKRAGFGLAQARPKATARKSPALPKDFYSSLCKAGRRLLDVGLTADGTGAHISRSMVVQYTGAAIKVHAAGCGFCGKAVDRFSAAA